jgi:hypothetical protein
LPYFLFMASTTSVWSISLIFTPGVGPEIGDGRGRQSADPEVRVDLAVLDGVGGFGDAEALATHVLVLVEAGGLDHAERHHFWSRCRANRWRRACP